MDLKINGLKIVIADDSPIIIKRVQKLLNEQGYQVFTAFDGGSALELIESVRPDLIILDVEMPVMNGLEVCKIVKSNEETALIPIIIFSSSDSLENKNIAVEVGANDFLSKSFDIVELKLKVESLLKLKSAIDQLESAQNIIKAFVKAVEVKDKYTVGHAERVSMYAVQIAQKIGLEQQQVKDITIAGLLHDIGKIGISDAILNKPGKLTDEEFAIIKQHPVSGDEICSPIKSFDRIKRIIRHHHEKLNGSGYPDGISGDEINIETRIMTVADIYDALTSNRAYRTSMEKSGAFGILENSVQKGEIDMFLVEALRQIVDSEMN